MPGPFQVLKPSLTLRPREPKPGSGAEKAGPLAWWKLDETSGTNAVNAVGATLTGHLHGQPRWLPAGGRHGGALELAGERDWIECADSADLDFRAGITVSLWVKPAAAGRSIETVAAKGGAWQLQRSRGSGHWHFTLTGPSATGSSKGRAPSVVCKRALDDGQWHHLAASYDGKRIALYVDGVEEDAMTATGMLALNNLPVTVGENLRYRGRAFRGSLDEVRLYERGLSAAEVKALFDADTKN